MLSLADGPEEGTFQADQQDASLMARLQSLNGWIRDDAPVALDGLQWTVHMVDTFSQRAQSFCEDVFKQLFDRLESTENAAPANTPAAGQKPSALAAGVEPMLMLRALSKVTPGGGHAAGGAVNNSGASRLSVLPPRA